MATLLITGANRGIGLGLVKVYLENQWQVIASCRSPKTASELMSLKEQYSDKISIIGMDVNDQTQIDAAVQSLNGDPIDVLINNAGTVERENMEAGPMRRLMGSR